MATNKPTYINSFVQKITEPVSITPLAVFRILFGLIMAIGSIRFLANGWVDCQYVDAIYQFKYAGFEWVKPLGLKGMTLVEYIKVIVAFMVMLGLLYRPAIVIYFLGFTYTELIDKTYYLNHYYFVSIISFLMIWLPANRRFSLDTLIFPRLYATHVPRWTVGVIRLQLGLVYFFAGFAKLNYDWLINAMPLKLWLPANDYLPVIGNLFKYEVTAYLFSWGGALYDLIIPFMLINRNTRKFAYMAVIFFHLMTAALFNIGMFPFIMIFSTLIFFNAEEYHTVFSKINVIFGRLFGFNLNKQSPTVGFNYKSFVAKGILGLMLLHFILQVLLPFRHTLYPGNLFWTEEGYRFSWRVMLMEKSGYAQFYVKDGENGREGMVNNCDFLNSTQEKQMSFQPDMIMEYAHFLAQYYKDEGMADPHVRAEVHVTLNGRRSQLMIDPQMNLAALEPSLSPKNWILPLAQ